jgi:cysteine desulfurase
LPVYLDNHATTRVDPRVAEAMWPYLTERFGNAASRTHAFGWAAEKAVEDAREQVAALIGARAQDIVFTSGATESDNLAVKGVALGAAGRAGHIITQATEHHAILDACRAMERQGCRVTVLPVDADGLVDLNRLEEALKEDTLLVSIMSANNEVGVLQPVPEIGTICRARGVLFHTDAAQAVGRIPVDVDAMPADLVSISGHKFYGPKGVGALYVRSRPRPRMVAQMDGGGHERGLRSGTLNVPGIVGLGQAAALAAGEMPQERPRTAALRNRLHRAIAGELDGVHLNGHPEKRLEGNLNLSFAQADGEALLMALPDLALSSGSACTSASLEPSYVLRAMGVPKDLARNSIRFGLGRFTTAEEVDYAASRVVAEVTRLRRIASRPLSRTTA